jgi:hypothetical protein
MAMIRYKDFVALNFVSVEQAAQICGSSAAQINRQIRDGVVCGFSGGSLISWDQVYQIQERQKRYGGRIPPDQEDYSKD